MPYWRSVLTSLLNKRSIMNLIMIQSVLWNRYLFSLASSSRIPAPAPCKKGISAPTPALYIFLYRLRLHLSLKRSGSWEPFLEVLPVLAPSKYLYKLQLPIKLFTGSGSPTLDTVLLLYA